MPAGRRLFWKSHLNDFGAWEKVHIAFSRPIHLPLDLVSYGMGNFSSKRSASEQVHRKLEPHNIFFDKRRQGPCLEQFEI